METLAARNSFLFRPGALGDTILVAPALAALRARPPGTRIALAAHEGATRLLAASGLIDLSLSSDDPRLAALFGDGDNLRPLADALGPLDAAVAWLSDKEGKVAANLHRLGARQVVVNPSQPAADSEQHVADYLAGTLVASGLADVAPPAPPLLLPPKEEVGRAAAFLARLPASGGGVVAVHPGSGGVRKNWPPELFAAVINDLGRDSAVLLLGGPADARAVAEVQAKAGSSALPVCDLPLPRVAALLHGCGAYLGNDSGLTHLASMLGVPTVALFGPTDPRRWRPLGPRVKVLSWAAGPSTLSPDEVARVVREVMAG